uniref:R1.BtsI n=1 Tax=Parageobacillus thermoglucosidasius TaxID=1426 RepID=Q2I0M0_PARTM|nr:R1.BtsI [Parageobacillus thermoglucosidasius]
MKITEGIVHVAMRHFLKSNGWKLIAGQYPGGSDDELTALNIVDPVVARDNSPDPRRHSLGKIVPDLIAYKNDDLLVIEAKPKYSQDDRDKLLYLLSERKHDFYAALEKFATERNHPELLPVSKLNIIPGLAFSASENKFKKDPGFVYIRVSGIFEAFMEGYDWG